LNPVAYLGRRVAQIIPVLLLVTVIVFFMIHLIPGDPAVTMLGSRATPDALARLREQLGLDQALPTQYALFMRNLGSLNLGQSIHYKVPVTQLVVQRLPITLALAAYTLVLTVLITVPLALFAALNQNRLGDHIVRFVGMLALTTPSFWIAILLLILFSVKLRIFPVGGLEKNLPGLIRSLFLPALTLAFGLIAPLTRTLRASLIDVLQTDYVSFARAKGLSERKVLLRHVVRSGLIPMISLLGVNLSLLIGGTVVVEKVFSLPGAGALIVESIFARDYPVIQALALTFALIVILINLFTDVIYAALDPRITLQ
jgi:peptide/nickel transport system permease protein